MKAAILEWIVSILIEHKSLLSIAIKQRSKFEGWLKYELASRMLAKGATSMEVEAAYPSSKTRSDIHLKISGKDYYIELKTANTNWNIKGTTKKAKPITMNVNGIIKDIEKLRSLCDRGISAFILFPVPLEKEKYWKYMERISKETNIDLSKTLKFRTMTTSLGGKDKADILICVLEVSN